MSSQLTLILVVIAAVVVAARLPHRESRPRQKISCYVAEDKIKYGFSHCETIYNLNSGNRTLTGVFLRQDPHVEFEYLRSDFFIERRQVCLGMLDEFGQPTMKCICITDECNKPKDIYSALSDRSQENNNREFDF